MKPDNLWPVLAAYLLAALGVLAFSLLGVAVLRPLHPDSSDREVILGLPGLLAGGFGAACGLGVTFLAVARPLEAARWRLVPGREAPHHVAAAVLGTLALSQGLDSLATLGGLAGQGALAHARRVLAGATGGELFAAVVVFGVLGAAAEELFFRAWMQTRLRARWRPATAVGVTSLAFALLHFDWVHVVAALALGLWLGVVTELAGSALPAVVAHVANNVAATLLTALAGPVVGRRWNVAVAGLALVVFLACLARVVRELGPRPAPPA